MPSEFNRPFGRLSPCGGQVAYALLTRPPLAANVLLHRAAARLACVRPAASVYPEPGSNSSLYKIVNCLSCHLKELNRKAVNFFRPFPFTYALCAVKICSNIVAKTSENYHLFCTAKIRVFRNTHQIFPVNFSLRLCQQKFF